MLINETKHKVMIDRINSGTIMATSEGDVYSFTNGKFKKITGSIMWTGYRTYFMRHDGVFHRLYIHRIVYCYFNGDIPPQYEINHKNFIKTDNRICNLEAIPKIENMRHAFRNGKMVISRGEQRWNAKLTAEQVKEIRLKIGATKKKIGMELAKQYGVSHKTISKIKKRISWKHL